MRTIRRTCTGRESTASPGETRSTACENFSTPGRTSGEDARRASANSRLLDRTTPSRYPESAEWGDDRVSSARGGLLPPYAERGRAPPAVISRQECGSGFFCPHLSRLCRVVCRRRIPSRRRRRVPPPGDPDGEFALLGAAVGGVIEWDKGPKDKTGSPANVAGARRSPGREGLARFLLERGPADKKPMRADRGSQ